MKFDPILLEVEEAHGCDVKKMARAVIERKIPGSRAIIRELPTVTVSGEKWLQPFSFSL